jgi:hypothetical protein
VCSVSHFATITLYAARKTRATQVCTDVGIEELAVAGAEGAKSVADEYARAHQAYENSLIWKVKAQAISSQSK